MRLTGEHRPDYHPPPTHRRRRRRITAPARPGLGAPGRTSADAAADPCDDDDDGVNLRENRDADGAVYWENYSPIANPLLKMLPCQSKRPLP